MIDVHTILLGDENPEWLAQMIQSLADEPIALHIVRGQFGHIGKWRAAGFRRGSSPYVSYVDPDDYVLPGAFGACVAALEADPALDMAWTAEVAIQRDGTQIARRDLYPHHLCVCRRSFVDGALEVIAATPWYPEHVIHNAPRRLKIDRAGYAYRTHGSAAGRLMMERLHAR